MINDADSRTLYPTRVAEMLAGGIDLIDQLMIYLNAMKVQVTNQKKNGATLEQTFAALIPQFSRSYSHWDNPEWIRNAVEHFYNEL